MKRNLLLSLASLMLISACQSPENNTPAIVDQQLVYLASRGSGFDLYRSNQDGTGKKQLTSQPGWDWGPRWWQAKNGILHYSQDTAQNFAHRLINAEGATIPMDFQGLSDFIGSPDGKYALYTEKVGENDHVFMQDLNSQTATDITPYDAYHGRPKWSPGGQLIMMISDRTGSNELYLYKLKDGSLTQLTNGEGRAKYASWSPDGKQIAFTREVLEAPKKDHDIFLLELESKEVTQLTNTEFGEQEISWSPMGDKIAYHGTIDGKDDIYTIDLKTKEVTKITNGEGYHGEPTWIPIYKRN